MSYTTITFVRIYLTEAHIEQQQRLLAFLHDERQVRGVTLFRGISGFGRSGKMHSASLLDLSLDLPVVLEFFDTPEVVASLLPSLESQIAPGHLVHWTAQLNDSDHA